MPAQDTKISIEISIVLYIVWLGHLSDQQCCRVLINSCSFSNRACAQGVALPRTSVLLIIYVPCIIVSDMSGKEMECCMGISAVTVLSPLSF